MQLTDEVLVPFIDGDIEIQNDDVNYLYQGPIKSAKVEGDTLKVRCHWMAKNDGGPNAPSENWTRDDDPNYEIAISLCRVAKSAGRIILMSTIVGETVVLFPSGDSKLDPARVSGLPV